MTGRHVDRGGTGRSAGNARSAGALAAGLLDALRVENTSVRYRSRERIFAQGERAAAVMYIRSGRVKLTVTSPSGRAAVIGILAAGAFFGEEVLAGQRRRRATAETMTTSIISAVRIAEMRRHLHHGLALSESFRGHLLTRQVQIETDLVAHGSLSIEMQLARVLLLLAHFDEHDAPRATLPTVSRDLLAEVIGSTRAVVDVLMNRFRKLGYLERHRHSDGGLQVHRSMLSVVLREGASG